MTETEVAIIGAGPIGLELAVALKDAGVDYVHFEAKQIGHTISWYPKQMQYFSSPDRIAICDVPLNTSDQSKATREEYLAYLRGIVEQFDLDVRTYERVNSIVRDGDGIHLRTSTTSGEFEWRAQHVVVAIGDMHRPRMLGIEGEGLPHVSHYFDEPHAFFRRRLLIVGGKNSAVEAAIRCHRAGAHVAVSYRGAEFNEKSVKYWIKPEIDWLIKTGKIDFYPQTVPSRITNDSVTLIPSPIKGEGGEVPADFVLLLVGYEMDTTLLTEAGVELGGGNGAPKVDPETMQTNVPGLYVVGTAAAGTQKRFKLFIENCHPHVIRVMRSICGRDPVHINRLGFERLDESRKTIDDMLES